MGHLLPFVCLLGLDGQQVKKEFGHSLGGQLQTVTGLSLTTVTDKNFVNS